MVTTSEIAPAPPLAEFVRCYSYREFETYGLDFVKPWHASPDQNIVFFFKAVPVTLIDTATGGIITRGKSCGVVGMATQYNGEMTFNGSYSFFIIHFKPNGFYKIFNIPSFEIANKILGIEEILNTEIKFLHEQLAEADGMKTMTELSNTWLLHWLNKQRWIDYKDSITASANLIIKEAGSINLDKLAVYANMSIRSFERHFYEQVGISPKQLCCISRFNHALELKLRRRSMNWTSIAYQSGYFDQMHLIKDFKRFCGDVPTSLLKHMPLLEEKYISRVEV